MDRRKTFPRAMECREDDLFVLLRPYTVPTNLISDIKRRITLAEDNAASRARTLSKKNILLRKLKVELRLKVEDADRKLRHLERENDELKAQVERGDNDEYEQIFRMGTSVLADQAARLKNAEKSYTDQTAVVERLEASIGELQNANDQLRNEATTMVEGKEVEIAQRDMMIETLNQQIHFSNGGGIWMGQMMSPILSPSEAEAQAQRTLAFVQSLQQDVAEREEAITKLEVEVVKNRKEIATFKTSIEQAQAVAAERGSDAAALKSKLGAALTKITELKGVVQDQDKLVQRVMDENARLGGK